jgi:phosphatidylglycerophosphate synthase
MLLPLVIFGYVGCTWLFLVLFRLLVVAALSVLAGAGVLQQSSEIQQPRHLKVAI